MQSGRQHMPTDVSVDITAHLTSHASMSLVFISRGSRLKHSLPQFRYVIKVAQLLTNKTA